MENKNISTPNKPISRQSNIVVQEVENETLIYDLTENKAFCLNETSSIIWQMCDGTKTVAEISQAASRKFNANISEDFVWLALDQFKKDKLITNEFTSVFAGMSRREVIRKVGFASIVALPIVASMIAPTAVNALPLCNLAPQVRQVADVALIHFVQCLLSGGLFAPVNVLLPVIVVLKLSVLAL